LLRYGSKLDSLIFFVQKVAGRRLKDLAATVGGYDLAKFAIRKLWNDLPTIHRYWGFSGGIKPSNIFFDSLTKKITLINWDRA
jgi:hypothetical protein